MPSRPVSVSRTSGAGAGDFRRRVRFSRPNQTTDEYGNVTTGWDDLFSVSANISPRLGGETVMAARLTGRQPVIVRVRQTPDTRGVHTDWKVTDITAGADGTAYNIRTVADPYMGTVEHGKFLDMLAEAGVAI